MSTPENRVETSLPKGLIAVTDLGPNNTGTISCAGLTPEQRVDAVESVTKHENRAVATNRFRCVDGRFPAEGGNAPEGYADPRIPGGPAIAETAADMMVSKIQHMPVSELVRTNTISAKKDGLAVVVHGDAHNGKSGCGANKLMRQTLFYNADNLGVIKPKCWILGEILSLDKHLSEGDIDLLVASGLVNARSDNLWDITPEETIDVATESGAEYEELQGEHEEKVLVVDTSENTTELEDAFVASLGAYKKKLFERQLSKGKTEREAAFRMMSVVLFTVGVSKQLTAEDKGNGEALPVVIVGDSKAA